MPAQGADGIGASELPAGFAVKLHGGASLRRRHWTLHPTRPAWACPHLSIMKMTPMTIFDNLSLILDEHCVILCHGLLVLTAVALLLVFCSSSCLPLPSISSPFLRLRLFADARSSSSDSSRARGTSKSDKTSPSAVSALFRTVKGGLN